MKILIVMGGFFPGKAYGGPPVSVDNFCTLMSEDECYIVTRDHDLSEKERYSSIYDGWNNRGNCKVLYLSDKQFNINSFRDVILEIGPDVIYLQGLFQSCVLPCLYLAKKNHIKIILAPRGELCAGALSMKKWKKIPYIEMIRSFGLVKNIHLQSTSDEETEAIRRLIKADNTHIHRLDNVPSIPKTDYPRREKFAGEGRFVYLSRIHPKKNLLSAINYFKYINGNAEFDIYGPIEDYEYWNKCQKAILELPNNVTVNYKGLVEHNQVHEVFSWYDAFIFPTLSENYGHVIAECLLVGTPVIVSDQTPWKHLMANGLGWDIGINDNEAFIDAINNIINTDRIDFNTIKKTTNRLIEIDKLYNDYSNTFYNLI